MCVIVMCIVKVESIFCDVKCPICVILCIYSLHSFIENTFNFMIKILGHILTFFLGKGAYTLFDVNPHFQKMILTKIFNNYESFHIYI